MFHSLWWGVFVFYCCCKNNYHKLSSLQQHILIILWLEVQNGTQWDKIKILAELCSPGGHRRESFPLLCSFYRISKFLCLPPSSKPAMAEGTGIPSMSVSHAASVCHWLSCPSLPLMKTHWTHPDNSR